MKEIPPVPEWAYKMAQVFEKSKITKEEDMFGILSNLTKAVVGTVIETPIAVVADVVTLGGSLTDRDTPYTSEAVSKVVDNVQKATE